MAYFEDNKDQLFQAITLVYGLVFFISFEFVSRCIEAMQQEPFLQFRDVCCHRSYYDLSPELSL